MMKIHVKKSILWHGSSNAKSNLSDFFIVNLYYIQTKEGGFFNEKKQGMSQMWV